MASVTFKRTNNIDSVPIVDGQLIFDTSDQKIYLDNGNTREVYGGGSGTDLISNVSDATDNNAFNANATVNLFTRKSSIVDTKAEIQSVTQAGVPLGCKGFNEVIGTGDISALGDGSVTGAILANKSAIDTLNQNLTINFTDSSLPSTTTVNEYLQALVNKVFPKSVTVFRNGAFGIPCDNGLYKREASDTVYTLRAFNVGSNLTAYSYTQSEYTLVTRDAVDLSNFSKVKITNAGFTPIELDVSALTGSYYICLCAIHNPNSNITVVQAWISTSKENFGSSANGVIHGEVVVGTSSTSWQNISISEIVAE